MPSVLAFSGSIRSGSFNKKLIAIAAEGARRAGATVNLIDLSDFPMPIYNADLEASEGIPEYARAFKHLLIGHEGMLISSPEYNGAFSPLLKNALDWASRSEPDDDSPLAAYRGKVAAIMSASPGSLGGLRGLVHLRMLLNNLGVLALPQQQAVRRADTAFDRNGALVDDKIRSQIEQLGAELALTLEKLH